MGYVYHAKEAAVVPPDEPDDWPDPWPFPPPNWPDPDWPPPNWPENVWPQPDYPVWPPDWPNNIEDSDYSLTLSCDTTLNVGSAISFTLTTLDSGIDTDDLNNHIVAIHATLDGAAVNVKKLSGDEYSNMVWYYVSNYSGSSYGLSESIYVDIDAEDNGKTLTLCATLITVNPLLTDTDTATVQMAGKIVYWGQSSSPLITDPSALYSANFGASFSDTGYNYYEDETWADEVDDVVSYVVMPNNIVVFNAYVDGAYKICRSTNAGASWSIADAPSGQMIRVFAYADGACYMGTDNGSGTEYLYKSLDYGETFTLCGGAPGGWGTNGPLACINATSLISAKRGVYTSNDSGGSWTKVSSVSIFNIITVLSNGAILGIRANKVIAKSTNAGVGWADVLYSRVDILSICELDSGIVLSGAANKIYRSTDYGSTWTLVYAPVRYVTDFSYVGDGVVLACDSTFMYISYDYGVTWAAKCAASSHQFYKMAYFS